MTTLTNDVPSRLLDSFRADRAEAIAPLVAMGWNASTTVTVTREATVFDEASVKETPMWELAAQVGAMTVVGAWLNAPHPQPAEFLQRMGHETVWAWGDGRYALAQALLEHLNRRDPNGHEGRLRQALIALSDPGHRRINPAPDALRTTTATGLEHWHACGGNWAWTLDPIQKSRAQRHPHDLGVASPVVRWLSGYDRAALETLAAHGIDWIPPVASSLISLLVEWGSRAVSTGYPDSSTGRAHLQNQVMQDGLLLLEGLMTTVPEQHLEGVGETLQNILVSTGLDQTWNGQAEAWTRRLNVVYESRVLRDSSVLTGPSGPRDRPRL